MSILLRYILIPHLVVFLSVARGELSSGEDDSVVVKENPEVLNTRRSLVKKIGNLFGDANTNVLSSKDVSDIESELDNVEASANDKVVTLKRLPEVSAPVIAASLERTLGESSSNVEESLSRRKREKTKMKSMTVEEVENRLKADAGILDTQPKDAIVHKFWTDLHGYMQSLCRGMSNNMSYDVRDDILSMMVNMTLFDDISSKTLNVACHNCSTITQTATMQLNRTMEDMFTLWNCSDGQTCHGGCLVTKQLPNDLLTWNSSAIFPLTSTRMSDVIGIHFVNPMLNNFQRTVHLAVMDVVPVEGSLFSVKIPVHGDLNETQNGIQCYKFDAYEDWNTTHCLSGRPVLEDGKYYVTCTCNRLGYFALFQGPSNDVSSTLSLQASTTANDTAGSQNGVTRPTGETRQTEEAVGDLAMAESSTETQENATNNPSRTSYDLVESSTPPMPSTPSETERESTQEMPSKNFTTTDPKSDTSNSDNQFATATESPPETSTENDRVSATSEDQAEVTTADTASEPGSASQKMLSGTITGNQLEAGTTSFTKSTIGKEDNGGGKDSPATTMSSPEHTGEERASNAVTESQNEMDVSKTNPTSNEQVTRDDSRHLTLETSTIAVGATGVYSETGKGSQKPHTDSGGQNTKTLRQSKVTEGLESTTSKAENRTIADGATRVDSKTGKSSHIPYTDSGGQNTEASSQSTVIDGRESTTIVAVSSTFEQEVGPKAKRLRFVFYEDFNAVVRNDIDAFVVTVRSQLAKRMDVKEERIVNITAVSGSIVVSFTLLPPTHENETESSAAIKALQILVHEESKVFKDANGNPLKFKAGSLTVDGVEVPSDDPTLNLGLILGSVIGSILALCLIIAIVIAVKRGSNDKSIGPTPSSSNRQIQDGGDMGPVRPTYTSAVPVKPEDGASTDPGKPRNRRRSSVKNDSSERAESSASTSGRMGRPANSGQGAVATPEIV